MKFIVTIVIVYCCMYEGVLKLNLHLTFYVLVNVHYM